MHSVTVDGPSVVSAFIQTPPPQKKTPQHTDTNTHFPPPQPVTKGRLSLSLSGRMQLFSWSEKNGKTASSLHRYDNCVDTWAQPTIGLFPYVTQVEHTHLCVCVERGSAGLYTSPCDVRLSHKEPAVLRIYDKLSQVIFLSLQSLKVTKDTSPFITI